MPLERYWEDISMTHQIINLDGIKKDPRTSAVNIFLNLKPITTTRLTLSSGKFSTVQSNALPTFNPAFQVTKYSVLTVGALRLSPPSSVFDRCSLSFFRGFRISRSGYSWLWNDSFALANLIHS
jgi:hypothetical protein